MSVTVTCQGQFTINEAADAARDILAALRDNESVVVDMNWTTRIDTAAVQLLVAAKKEAEGLGKQLIVNTSGHVDSHLQLLGVKLQ